MSVTLKQVDAITSSSYGFRTYDIDAGRGTPLVARICFDRTLSTSFNATYEPIDLRNKTVAEVAAIFYSIFLRNQNVEIEGSKYQAKSLYVQVTTENTILSNTYIEVREFPLDSLIPYDEATSKVRLHILLKNLIQLYYEPIDGLKEKTISEVIEIFLGKQNDEFIEKALKTKSYTGLLNFIEQHMDSLKQISNS